jgi:chemotaxis signal transduction protein
MSDRSSTANTAADIRNAFDRAFAEPPSSQALERIENLLAIRVAGHPYAIRVGEMTGLVNNRKILALPSPISELLGVAGIRGTLVPVYSMAALLGYNRELDQTARWIALCGAEEIAGLAFSDFESYLRVPLSHVYAADNKHMARGHIKEVAHMADQVRAVISIPSAMEIIKKRCAENRSSKGR